MSEYYEDYYLVPQEEFGRRLPGVSFTIVETLDDLNARFARELADL